MAASDSESSLSGADVTITAVHPSPFRDPTTGDEFDGQGISFKSFEAPESRDIQAFLDSQRSPTTPVSSSSDAEVPEFTLPASSTDFQDPRPARKRQQRRVPPASKAPGSIGRQARDKTPGGSSVDRMEMGGALDAVLAHDSVEEQEDVGIHSMYSGQASSAYPAAKTPGSSPRTEGYGSPRDKTPRIQVQVPTDKLAKKLEPFAGPRPASDPRLRESSQHLETEHFIEKDAIGGAMSVKLVSWAEPLKITPNHPDVVERNARYLARLYHEANIKEPPIMEWAFLANVTQAYTGNKETLFSHAASVESKQHMFWTHYLREPFCNFSTKDDDSAVHRYTLFFAHGTNTAGAEGIMNSCYLAPATLADGPGTNWSDEGSLQRVVQSGKWQCPVMIHGVVMTPAANCVLESGGGQEAQQACMIHAAVHYKRDKKWLLHSDLTTVSSFVIAVKKQFQPLRDHLGRPIFQLGPTHTASVKQHLR